MFPRRKEIMNSVKYITKNRDTEKNGQETSIWNHNMIQTEVS